MRYVTILFLMALGCWDAEPAPQTIKIETPFSGIGDRYAEMNPWVFDETPWKTWVREPDLSYGKPYQLTLKLFIRMPDSEPVKRFSGGLRIADSKGNTVYDEPHEYAPDVSFSAIAGDAVSIEYEDENASHRALRFDNKLAAKFTPERMVYADGREVDLE